MCAGRYDGLRAIYVDRICIYLCTCDSYRVKGCRLDMIVDSKNMIVDKIHYHVVIMIVGLRYLCNKAEYVNFIVYVLMRMLFDSGF